MTHALAWAGRLLRESEFATGLPDGTLDQAGDACRRIVQVFGHSRRADDLLGRWCLLSGNYPDAKRLLAGTRQGTLLADAELRESIREELLRANPELHVFQVERVPGTRSSWVVLRSKWLPEAMDFPREGSDHFETATLLHLSRTHQVVQDTTPIKIGSTHIGEASSWRHILTSRLSNNGPPGLVYMQAYHAADCLPVLISVFSVAQHSIHTEGWFDGIEDTTSIIPPTKNRNLAVVFTPTYKVYWPDVYEWTPHEFVLADTRFRHVFQISASYLRGYGPFSYVGFSRQAAVDGIQGRYELALGEWKRAANLCKRALSAAHGSRYYDSGYDGTTAENLKDIRKRIRWLERGEYNHWLLYRPYDFDLQVPPYKLGNAKDW